MQTVGYLTTKSILMGVMGILQNCPEALYWPWSLELPSKPIKDELPIVGYKVDHTNKKVIIFGCKRVTPEIVGPPWNTTG